MTLSVWNDKKVHKKQSGHRQNGHGSRFHNAVVDPLQRKTEEGGHYVMETPDVNHLLALIEGDEPSLATAVAPLSNVITKYLSFQLSVLWFIRSRCKI